MRNKPSFRHTAIKGLSWLAVVRLAEKTISVLRTIILARLLTPNDFGIFGIALLTLSLVETFSETGIGQALIQKPQKIDSDLPTTWMILAIRGLILSGLVIFSSNFVAQFFNLSEPGLIALVGLVPLFRGLSNPATILWQKRLQFKFDILYRFSSSFFEAIISIVLAFLTRSVWSLPLAFVSAAILQTLISLIFAPLHLGKLKRSTAKYLFKFGRWMNLNSIISYLAHEGDDFVVGKLLNTYSLGLYQTAYRISSLPATHIAGAAAVVGFPLLSAQKQAKLKLTRAIKMAWSVAYPSCFFAGIVILFARQLIQLILGSPWLPMTFTLKLLIIHGLIRSINSALNQYFLSQGKPSIITFIGSIKLTTIAALIVPAILLFNIEGAASVTILASIIAFMVFLFILSRRPGSQQLTILKNPLLAMIITMLITSLVNLLTPQNLLGFAINLIIYSLTFTIIALSIDQLLNNIVVQEAMPLLPASFRTLLKRINQTSKQA